MSKLVMHKTNGRWGVGGKSIRFGIPSVKTTNEEMKKKKHRKAGEGFLLH